MPFFDESDVPESNRPVLPTALVRSAGGQVASPVTAVPTAADQPSAAGGGTSGGPVSTPTGWAVLGKRTDLPQGVGIRFQMGFDSSVPPMWVIEQYSESGVRTAVTFS